MARIRTLKPDIWTDEKFALLSTGAKLLFIGAISTADDAGRFRAHPALLKANIFPLDQTKPADLDKWLAELVGAGMVELYQVRGETFAQLTNWRKHQRLDNASKDRVLPGPDDPEAVSTDPPRVAAVRGESRRVAAVRGWRGEERKGEEGSGEEEERTNLSGLGAAQPDLDRDSGDETDERPAHPAPVRALSELEWRVEETWRAHLAQWRGFYLDTNGRVPIREPTLTDEIRKAIRAAIREYDGHLLGKELRPRWVEESKARAAGIGIFLDPWCSGNARDNDARSGGKRYLEHWRPWARQRGKQSPVDRFAELYFEAKSLGPGAVVAPQPPARTDIPETEEAHAYVA